MCQNFDSSVKVYRQFVNVKMKIENLTWSGVSLLHKDFNNECVSKSDTE